jgi:hypothetical protein
LPASPAVSQRAWPQPIRVFRSAEGAGPRLPPGRGAASTNVPKRLTSRARPRICLGADARDPMPVFDRLRVLAPETLCPQSILSPVLLVPSPSCAQSFSSRGNPR